MQDLRRGGRARLARRLKANASEPHLPRQRDARQRGQPRPGGDRPHQPVLLVPAARRRSAPGDALGRLAYFAPHDPGYVLDVSGAGVLKSSKHQAAAQKFLAFLVSKQGQEIIADRSDSYEYPIGSGVTTRRRRRRSTSSSPTRSRSPSSATARPRSTCCSRPACCDRRWRRSLRRPLRSAPRRPCSHGPRPRCSGRAAVPRRWRCRWSSWLIEAQQRRRRRGRRACSSGR